MKMGDGTVKQRRMNIIPSSSVSCLILLAAATVVVMINMTIVVDGNTHSGTQVMSSKTIQLERDEAPPVLRQLQSQPQPQPQNQQGSATNVTANTTKSELDPARTAKLIELVNAEIRKQYIRGAAYAFRGPVSNGRH